MKRFAILIACFAALISCQKAELSVNNGEEHENNTAHNGLVFRIDPTVRSTVNTSDGSVTLEVGDKVKIFYGATSEEGEVKSSGGDLYLETNISPSEEGPFYAVYPSSNSASLAGDVLTVDIPRVNSGNWSDVNIMAAKTTKSQLSFAFKHVCAYLSIEVSAADISAGYNKFYLARAEGDGKLFGTQEVTFDGSGNISLGTATEDSGSYFSTLQYFASAGTYYFPVLAEQTYGSGLIICRFKDKRGLLRSAISSIARGHVAVCGNVSSKIDAKANFYITPSGTGNGTSWADAASLSDLQTKISAATAEPQSWLVNGVNFLLKGNETYTANLTINNAASYNIMGAYQGSGAPGARDTSAYKTYIEQASADAPIVSVTGGSGIPVFDGITFRNATITGPGAAVSATGGQVDFHACSFLGNTASTFGGAIFIDTGGKVNISDDCVFKNNTAGRGGAIYLRAAASRLNVSDSRFSLNSSTQSNQGGGAMYLISGNSDISDCAFENNTATTYGGAVYALGNTHNFTDCTFTGNTAVNGGAFAVQGSTASVAVTVQIRGGEMSGNIANNATANNGGGAIWMSQGNRATVQCDHVNFIGNKVVSAVNSRGGAICMVNGQGGALMVNGCVFKGNGFEITGATKRAVYGSSIACQYTSGSYNDAAVYNSVFTDGFATNATTAGIGAIMFSGSGLLVNSTVVEDTGATGDIVRYATIGTNRAVIYNSIVLDPNDNTKAALNNVTSSGYVITTKVGGGYGVAASDNINTANSPTAMGLDFSSNAYGAWSGTYAGFTNGADATGAKNAVLSHDGIGTAFDEWLLSLDSEIYSKSGNGTTRTAPFWPGAYQN